MGCHSSNSFIVFLVTKHRRKDSILAQKILVQRITCLRTDLQYNMGKLLMSIFDSSTETNLLIKWVMQSSTSRRKINHFVAKDFHD